MRVVVRLAGLLLVAPGISLAQAGWIPPQPPCELPPANSKINNAIAALRGAADKPESRDQQLAQAKRLLSDAIVQDNQGANPAAWYYLGRLAVTTSDVAGADTALARAAALAPTCADDIARYRHDLWGDLLNNGLAAWQDGRQDSGLVLLRLAVRLEPANPKPLAAAAGLLASRGNDDSAFAYYRLAAKTAGADTGFATDKRDALANAWHLVVRRVQGHPAAQRALRLRAGLDSTQREIASDSTVLARLLASSQSRKARGTRLAPADQQLFTRDSTARAQAVAQRRAHLATALGQIAADSSALAAAFAPAIDALSEYVRAYPGEPEAATSLATLYAQSGRWAPAAAGGGRDSTRAYVARADSGLAVEISVPGFVPDTAGASLSGIALSLKSAPTTPFHLTVEFLDARGQVVATASHDVPSLSPRQSHPFDLQASGRRIAGWRYRTS